MTIEHDAIWATTPMTPRLGAELHGPDLGSLDPDGDAHQETCADLLRLLDKYRVLAVRDQRLDPEALHRLARRLGPFSGNPVHVPLEGFDDIVRFDRSATDTGPAVGENWHMDLAWFEKPPGATLLYGEIVPPLGGDTVFACLHHAWEGLSDRMQALLEGLVGVHSGKGVFALNASLSALDVKDSGWEIEAIERRHPLVCQHPRTGRRYLLLSSVLRRFDGMTERESRPLIGFLLEHAVQPAFTSRLTWAPGTLAIWANNTLLHAAINDYTGHRRLVYRTTVEGFRPEAAA